MQTLPFKGTFSLQNIWVFDQIFWESRPSIMSPFPKWNLQSQIWRSIDYWSAKLSIKSQRKFHFNWAPKRFDIQIRPKSSQMFSKYRSKTTAVRPIFLANWTTVARKILAEQQITSGSTAIFCLRSTWIELNPGRELRSSKNLLWGLKRNLVAIGIHFLWCCTRAPHVFIIWTVWRTLIATSVLRPADYYHNSRRPSCGQSNYASSATAACYRLFAGLNAPTNRTLSVEQCCEYIDIFN